MLDPAPTTKIAPTLARGVLAEAGAMTAGRQESVTIEFPNTNYRVRLTPTSAITSRVGKRILGTIHVDARRIDTCDSGGQYLDPVYGEPRRVQGRVVEVTADAVVVHAGVPVHLRPTERDQSPGDFEAGQFVTCNVMPGATFTPEG